LEELGIPELTSEQIEELCKLAEEKARKYITLRVPQKQIEKLDVTVEVEGVKPVRLSINVDIRLSQRVKNIDIQKLAGDATKNGLNAAEEFLRRLTCQHQK